MHLDIPDRLWSEFCVKASSILPDAGGQAGYKMLGALIQNCIDAKDNSEILLTTKSGKSMSLTNINDRFFQMFLSRCAELNPDSDKPEIDYFLDCMLSLVDADKRVLLMNSISKEPFDKMNQTIEKVYGFDDGMGIYSVITKMLIKAGHDKFIPVVFGDPTNLEFADDGTCVILLDGINLDLKGQLTNPEVTSKIFGNILSTVGSLTVEELTSLQKSLTSVMGIEEPAIPQFVKYLAEKESKGKLAFINLDRAPVTAEMGETGQIDTSKSLTVVISGISEKTFHNLRAIQKDIVDTMSKSLPEVSKAYETPGLGTLIFILDFLSITDNIDYKGEFSAEKIQDLLNKTRPNNLTNFL